ncbi:hypothetical protein C5N13_01090 [Sinorhizobium meliloti]|nr:hypothetical protein C5N13_01090 [Sinorhizobium meliloti]
MASRWSRRHGSRCRAGSTWVAQQPVSALFQTIGCSRLAALYLVCLPALRRGAWSRATST